MREFVVVLGDGGFAREVKAWAQRNDFICNAGLVGKDDEARFIKQSESYYKAANMKTNLLLGFGSPPIKKKVYEKFSQYEFFNFINLIDKSVISASDFPENIGLIICPNTIVTTNVKFGKCVTINLSCTIGHDAMLDDFVSLMPQVAISGGVHLAEEAYCGVGASILENVWVGKQAIIGGGALVNKTVEYNTTVVGVPAKRIVK